MALAGGSLISIADVSGKQLEGQLFSQSRAILFGAVA